LARRKVQKNEENGRKSEREGISKLKERKGGGFKKATRPEWKEIMGRGFQERKKEKKKHHKKGKTRKKKNDRPQSHFEKVPDPEEKKKGSTFGSCLYSPPQQKERTKKVGRIYCRAPKRKVHGRRDN